MVLLLAAALVLAALGLLAAVAGSVVRRLAEFARVAELCRQRLVAAQTHAMPHAERLQQAAAELADHLAALERATDRLRGRAGA
ncbi:MAG: hypothetical protein FWJ70_12040 [Micromonosporaceae bacterium]